MGVVQIRITRDCFFPISPASSPGDISIILGRKKEVLFGKCVRHMAATPEC